MKINVEIVEAESQDDLEVVIRCKQKTPEVEKMLQLLFLVKTQVHGKKDGVTSILDLDQIYYFEAVENKVFAYALKDVYEVTYKIQELINLLTDTTFTQVTRTVILNIDHVHKIKTLVNGRLKVELDNQEEIIINRVYANEFKNKLKAQVRK